MYTECLPNCFVATYCPCSSSVCCTAVNCTLINKYKLLSFICSNTCHKFHPFLSTLLNGNTS